MKFQSFNRKSWLTGLVLLVGSTGVLRPALVQAGPEEKSRYKELKEELKDSGTTRKKNAESLSKLEKSRDLLVGEKKKLGVRDESCTQPTEQEVVEKSCNPPSKVAASVAPSPIPSTSATPGVLTGFKSFDALWRSKYEGKVLVEGLFSSSDKQCKQKVRLCSDGYKEAVDQELTKVTEEISLAKGELEILDKKISESKTEKRELEAHGCPDCDHASGVSYVDPYKNMWKTALVSGAFGLGETALIGGLDYGLQSQALNNYSSNYSQYSHQCMQLGINCGGPLPMGAALGLGMGGMGIGMGGMGGMGGFGLMGGMGLGGMGMMSPMMMGGMGMGGMGMMSPMMMGGIGMRPMMMGGMGLGGMGMMNPMMMGGMGGMGLGGMGMMNPMMMGGMGGMGGMGMMNPMMMGGMGGMGMMNPMMMGGMGLGGMGMMNPMMMGGMGGMGGMGMMNPMMMQSGLNNIHVYEQMQNLGMMSGMGGMGMGGMGMPGMMGGMGMGGMGMPGMMGGMGMGGMGMPGMMGGMGMGGMGMPGMMGGMGMGGLGVMGGGINPYTQAF